MTRGYVIMAQNTEKTNYVKCAYALELSIKHAMPNANVTIITTDMLPHGDLALDSDWKLINDWQVYDASPYDETIKIEADMFIPRDISHWFDILSIQDVVVCTKIRNYKGDISKVRTYRKFIDDNNLPDVYNAITYFKKSDTAEQFFYIVRNVFEHWEEYKTLLKCKSTEKATTDWVYAIASHILGKEKTTLPEFDELSMVHMKQFISGTVTEDWTDTLVYECMPDVLRVNTYSQAYPFHYHSKTFADKIIESH